VTAAVTGAVTATAGARGAENATVTGAAAAAAAVTKTRMTATAAAAEAAAGMLICPRRASAAEVLPRRRGGGMEEGGRAVSGLRDVGEGGLFQLGSSRWVVGKGAGGATFRGLRAPRRLGGAGEVCA